MSVMRRGEDDLLRWLFLDGPRGEQGSVSETEGCDFVHVVSLVWLKDMSSLNANSRTQGPL